MWESGEDCRTRRERCRPSPCAGVGGGERKAFWPRMNTDETRIRLLRAIDEGSRLVFIIRVRWCSSVVKFCFDSEREASGLGRGFWGVGGGVRGSGW